jgi:hypothetical protein
MKLIKLAGFLFLILTASAFAQDRVDMLAHAIAKAEGFGVKGAVPTRYHNPGDIRTFKVGVHYAGQIGVNKQGYVIFKNDAAGFAALRANLRKMAAGESQYYGREMTIVSVAKLYATKWRTWSKNVAKNLGVSPTTTLREYFMQDDDVQPPVVQIEASLDFLNFNPLQ